MTPSVTVTPAMREQLPDLAAMFDRFNQVVECFNRVSAAFDAQAELLDQVAKHRNELLARVETLEALLKAKGGAA